MSPDAMGSLQDRVRYSMQTWYGQFYMPANLYIGDLNRWGADFDLNECANNANNGNGIQYADKIFEQGGSLIVNFEIVSFNEGRPHLRYSGGNGGRRADRPGGGGPGDMWEQEGFNPVPSPDPDVPTPGSYDDGDVVLVDTMRSVNDRYKAGIFNIN